VLVNWSLTFALFLFTFTPYAFSQNSNEGLISILPESSTQSLPDESKAKRENTVISILDGKGNTVFQQKLKGESIYSGPQTEVLNAQLNPGIYFVRVVSGEEVATTKLIVK
jgi:hypothetical protein